MPGIGPHVDGERNTVVAVNIGATRELCLCAYNGIQTIGPRTQITLNPGDLYVFDVEAAGTKTSGMHIRHWASGGRGDKAYIAKIEAQHVKKLKAKKGDWARSMYTLDLLNGKPQEVRNLHSFIER